MKLITSLVVLALLLATCQAVDNLGKETQLAPSASGSLDTSSFLESIFGKFNAASQTTNQNDNGNTERSIFKGLQALNSLRDRGEDGKEQNGFELPYQALLPRRRLPLDLKLENAEKLFGFAEQKSQTKPLQDFLLGLNQQNGQNEENNKWQNPLFASKQNGELLPFFNIFGKKRNKRTRVDTISESQIQRLLISKVPFLKGGKLVKMVANHYKKGTFLNIEFEDKDKKMYDIIARFRARRHKLEVVSIKLNKSGVKIDTYLPAALEDKSSETKTLDMQSQLKHKEDQLKTLHQKLQQMEKMNKILSEKASSTEPAKVQPTAEKKVQIQASNEKKQEAKVSEKAVTKETPEVKTQATVEKKAQTQTTNDKKQKSQKQTPKVVEEKKTLTEQQPKKQQQVVVKEAEKPNQKAQQKDKPATGSQIKNIQSQ